KDDAKVVRRKRNCVAASGHAVRRRAKRVRTRPAGAGAEENAVYAGGVQRVSGGAGADGSEREDTGAGRFHEQVSEFVAAAARVPALLRDVHPTEKLSQGDRIRGQVSGGTGRQDFDYSGDVERQAGGRPAAGAVLSRGGVQSVVQRERAERE